MGSLMLCKRHPDLQTLNNTDDEIWMLLIYCFFSFCILFPGISPAVELPLLIESFYFSVTGLTVTVVGSNSGVLGRSGSGGLGGAAAGFGSSFFFGAIVDGSQETQGGETGEGDQANR